MRMTVLSPVGAEITGLALARAGAPVITRLRGLLGEHGVVILREQRIDDAEFVGFLRRFGELMFTAGETPVPGFPDLNVVSNVGRSTPPRSVFHTDTSYVPRTPTYTALRAVEVPALGGETLFTNQYRACETLPAPLRARLDGRTVTHAATVPGQARRCAEHPVLRRHRVSGRTALYLSTPERCVAVSGMDETEGAELIEFLYAHSTSPANTYRHTWSPGDVVMWDNGCVLHRADHSGVSGRRVLHRGMVAEPAGDHG